MISWKKCCLVLLAGLTVILCQTNPRQKTKYVIDASRHIHHVLCERTGESAFEHGCEALLPFIKVSFKGALYLYTEEPQDFGLFSIFITHFPGIDIYAIGLGGQFIYVIRIDE